MLGELGRQLVRNLIWHAPGVALLGARGARNHVKVHTPLCNPCSTLVRVKVGQETLSGQLIPRSRRGEAILVR